MVAWSRDGRSAEILRRSGVDVAVDAEAGAAVSDIAASATNPALSCCWTPKDQRCAYGCLRSSREVGDGLAEIGVSPPAAPSGCEQARRAAGWQAWS